MSVTYDRVIADIVQTVFATMLNLDVLEEQASPPEEPDPLWATVHLSGAWTGSVVLELPLDVSRAAAIAMLQLSDLEITEEDCIDVAAELVNMIGGNLKSIMPGPSFLSLPTVIRGHGVGLFMHDAALVERVVFRSAAGAFLVWLYERTGADNDATRS